MPDLNITNPRVRDEIHKVVGFWLELGLSGFRVDAAPFLIELTGAEQAEEGDPHEYLRDLRAFLARRRATRSCSPRRTCPRPTSAASSAVARRCMVFNFVANQRLFLLVRRQNGAAGRGAGRDAPHPRGQPVGQFREEPRRAQLGQAHRRRTRGGVRRVRARRGHAHLRPRHPPPGPAHAGWRPPPAGARLQPAVRPRVPPSCCTARRSGWATT